MKVNHEKLLRALLAKAYKKQDGEIDEILNSSEEDGHETALTSILDIDSARISALKTPKQGQTFQDGYAKGKKEVLSQFETDLKEKFGIDSEAQGIELVETLVAEKTKTSGKTKELTDDDVKKHPAYINAEKAFKKQLKDIETDRDTKLTEQEKGFKKTQVLQTIGKKAVEILNGLNPVLPKIPKVADNLKSTFLKEFDGFEYELQDDGSVIVLKEGKRLEDKHGNAIDFTEMIKEKAGDFFEFAANNGGGNAGNGKPVDPKGGKGGNGGGTPPGIPSFKTEKEMLDYISNTGNKAADRLAAQENWEKANAPAV